jgi:hypothetical protein
VDRADSVIPMVITGAVTTGIDTGITPITAITGPGIIATTAIIDWPAQLNAIRYHPGKECKEPYYRIRARIMDANSSYGSRMTSTAAFVDRMIIRPTHRHIAISLHGGLYAMSSLCGSA